MRIGIFGGTFDPPHLGHLILAAEASDQLRLDRLLWVLTPDPPHKRSWKISPIEQRLELVKAAISEDDCFELSRLDIDRPGPHYTVDTVAIVRNEYPNADLYYLMGGDSLHDLPTWHDPKRLVENANGFGVMRRPGDDIDVRALIARLPQIENKIHFVEAPLLEIASHEIRLRISEGRPYRYYLLPAVYQMISQHKYYR